jgi:hypothetical protein
MTRLLICLLSFGIVSLAAEPAAKEGEWWSSVVQQTQFTAISRDGSLKLKVKLGKLAVTEKTFKTADGKVTRYYDKGKQLPSDWLPGDKPLVQFELYWDGKIVPIEGRFWRDLYGFRIMTSPLDPDKVPATQRDQFVNEFLSRLERPRVILSADGGTALIEWIHPEECDSRSIYRWIVTREGRVLRHRDKPPDEC